MKSSFLACSILLAAAGCSAEQGGLADANSEALTARTARAELLGETFISTGIYAYETYDSQMIQAKLRLTFTAADGYTLDSAANVGLDYEVTVAWVDVTTGRVHELDSTYFARKGASSSRYDFFDCDSTRNCSTGSLTELTLDGIAATLTNKNLYSVFGGVTEAPTAVTLTQVK